MVSEALLHAVEQSQKRAGEEASQELKKRIQEAMVEVQRLIKEFRNRDPELKRIVLFGSLAGEEPRNPNFDIDLSFEGRELYACTAIALNSCFKVDLVDYRSLPDFMQVEIDTHGKILYETDT
jgi:predicted nucleotidyltransferase